MTDTIQTTPKRFQCRHIHTDGRRCGSASLRGEEFCYFHHTSRQPVANPRTRRSRQATFDLPLPEDRGAIQISIGEVLRRIASNQIDPRRAGLLLYGLQIASLNLPNRHAPAPVEAIIEEIITDPHLGNLAPRTEIPDAEAPRTNSLTAKLLEAIRIGREEMLAESKAEPATLPALNASAAIHAKPGKHPRPQTQPGFPHPPEFWPNLPKSRVCPHLKQTERPRVSRY